MNLRLAAALLLASASLSVFAYAQVGGAPPAGAPAQAGPGGPGGGPGGRGPMTLNVTELGTGAWQLSGASNSALVLGADGAILVDSQFNSPEVLGAKVDELTKLPVRYVISSHAHPDHTGGNAFFAGRGATVISTVKAAAAMALPQPNGRGQTDPAVPPAGLPKETITAPRTITVGGVQAVLTPVASSHTDGDLFVYFPGRNILVTGDLFHSHEFPVYDGETSPCRCGNYDGNIAVLDQMLAAINDTTKIVPGHGPVTDKAHMQMQRDLLVRLKTQIQAAIAAGRTADEVAASKPLAGSMNILMTPSRDNSDEFVRNAYASIKAGR